MTEYSSHPKSEVMVAQLVIRAITKKWFTNPSACSLFRSFTSLPEILGDRTYQMLPQTGEGIKECEIVQWFVKPGDTVQEYDKLCTVQSDKATIEVTSVFSGTIESTLHPIGSIVQVGEPLVEYRSHNQQCTEASSPPPPTHDPCTKDQSDRNILLKRIPLTGYRRIMFQSMQESAYIPHCYAIEQVDTTALKTFATTTSTSFRILPYAVKALTYAIQHAPDMNSRLVQYSDKAANPYVIERQDDVHVGIAITTPQGLVVPCIKHAATKSVLEIQEDLTRLKLAAMSNSLSPDDIQGSTITISNIGSLGGSMGLATIKAKEAAIVALGKIEPNNSMTVTVGADHRFIDGDQLFSFSSKLRHALENPNPSIYLNM